MTGEEIGIDQNLIDFVEIAPENGYEANEINLYEKPASVYFVRTENNNYATFEFCASSCSFKGGSPDELNPKKSDWTLIRTYYYNHSGDRNLKYLNTDKSD